VSVRYLLQPKADEDIDEISDYLVEQGGLELALRFHSSAFESFSLIATHPEMGWLCAFSNKQLEETRKFQVTGPFDKYLIFYKFYNDRIEILRVLHGSQDLDLFFED